MSHETEATPIRTQMNEIMEKLQSPDLPESERNLLLIRAQGLMQQYTLQLELERRKLDEFNKSLQGMIQGM
ncbi:hypothetical protein [Polluticoccus soli]|uniref:hypothetical protein n=1 Tax=Polluticoccus soli TaxID=3034150 RepID=UPI0023E2DB7F|nr:hypothetical protein [Flavipsychrobacter sp. JY13-12]